MTYNIEVFDENSSSLIPAELFVEDTSNGVVLKLAIGNKSYNANDTFPFVALCKIREDLEQERKKICCKGNRIDVHPSGRMLVGFNAYKLVLGNQALDKDIVNIFSPETNLSLLGTVEEQKSKYNEWLNSL